MEEYSNNILKLIDEHVKQLKEIMRERFAHPDVISRIERLEKENKMRQDSIGVIDSVYNEFCEKMEDRIEKLETTEKIENKLTRICKLEAKVHEIVDFDNSLKESMTVLNDRITAIVKDNAEKNARRFDENVLISRRVTNLEQLPCKNEDVLYKRIKTIEDFIGQNYRVNLNNIREQQLVLLESWNTEKSKLENKINNIETTLADNVRHMNERINEQDNNIEGNYISEFKNNQNWIWELEKRIKEIEETIIRITEDNMREGKIPHKCPICCGYSKLQLGSECYGCDGKGIVWS